MHSILSDLCNLIPVDRGMFGCTTIIIIMLPLDSVLLSFMSLRAFVQ